jgi:hypothetical protein
VQLLCPLIKRNTKYSLLSIVDSKWFIKKRLTFDNVRARFATVKCWTAVLSLVAASAKLFRELTRASIMSAVAEGMILFAALANGSSVALLR